MVKGISKQVILVRSPNPELFEQAIFILSEKAMKREGISDQELLKEANAIVHQGSRHRFFYRYGFLCGCLGGALVGIVWLISCFI